VFPGIWAIQVLDPEWCIGFAEEVIRFEAWALSAGVSLSPPNTMNRYGLILDTPDETPRLDLTGVRNALSPVAKKLFPEVGGGELDSHHGFVVQYRMDGDRSLGFHADDAEVTMNLCLRGSFEGGDLWFEGRRCFQHHDDASQPDEFFQVTHRPGVALLHAGAHRHGARAIQKGHRENLILWMRSERRRQAEDPALGMQDQCPEWCGARR
jgi:hypothetical protein